MYLPGIPTGTVEDNHLIGAYQTNLLLRIGELQALFISGALDAFQWCVTSFVNEGVPRTEGRQLPITAFIINTRVDTMRRRMPV